MDFTRAKQNIITGLTHALGNRAIIDGLQVYYIRMATLLN